MPMIRGENKRFRVITMPVPQQEPSTDNDDARVRAQLGFIVDNMMPKITTMVGEVFDQERKKASKPESWLKAMLNPKNILSLIALAFSLGGAFVLWSQAIVTEEKLDAKLQPIIDVLNTNGKNINALQQSVTMLVELDKHQQQIQQARAAVSKFDDEYQHRIVTWSRNKSRPYPEKNAEHIKAEIFLDDLVKSRK
jgi:hypothetical protein